MRREDKEKAIILRKQGCSVGVIAKKLGASKASISLWVRDITLSCEQSERLHNNKLESLRNLNKARKTKAQSRWDSYKKEGFEKAKNDLEFAIVCALYWGEGSKPNKVRDFRLSNSDPLNGRYRLFDV